jgi:thioredoxin reductase (NADPH)
MPRAVHPTIEARRDQMFPVLEPEEIERLARFGEPKSYAAGARIFTTGEVAPGAFIVLAGRADSSQHRLGRSEPIVTHGPGGRSSPAARPWST